MHNTSFKLRRYEKTTKLAREVWRIKDKGGQFHVKWKIIGHHPGYNLISKRCILCLSEKMHILEYKGENLLNSRDELVSKCRHQNKYLLSNCDSND